MTFWLTSLWKASSVFPRRCHYKASLYCHTVHRRPGPGLWMKLAARDLACNFSPAFFLILKEPGQGWETKTLNIYFTSWLTGLCSSARFLRSNSCCKIQKNSDYLEKRRGLLGAWGSTKIPTNSEASTIPFSTCLTGNLGSLSCSSY